jgi:hypothetical protein
LPQRQYPDYLGVDIATACEELSVKLNVMLVRRKLPAVFPLASCLPAVPVTDSDVSHHRNSVSNISTEDPE